MNENHATHVVDQPTSASPEQTQQAPSEGPAVNGAVSWHQKNQRRLQLIDKQFARGLSAAETMELQQLQQELEQRLDALAPLPFEALERIKECARREGLLPSPSPQD